MKTLQLLILLPALLPAAARASANEPANYQPRAQVRGEIRIWGSPADGALLARWQEGFRRFHPDARFSLRLHGPESTLAGVYTGVADLAFMARELRVPLESMAFEWVHRRKPFQVEIANASMDARRPAANLVVFVHEDNPVEQLTLAQLDAIFGAEHRRGVQNIRTWGGVTPQAAWKDRGIKVYGPPVDSIDALFIRTAVMRNSRKWNPDYRESSSYDEVLTALARDPAGIAYAPAGLRREKLRAVALAEDAPPFHALTPQTVAERSYPLTRVVTMALDRKPREPIDPKLKEFLRYILSEEGQSAVARDRFYIPLSGASVRRQLERLEGDS